MPTLTINITVTNKQKTKLDRYLTKFVDTIAFPTIEAYLGSLTDAQATVLIKEMNKQDSDVVGNAFDNATPAIQAQVNTLLGLP